MMNEKVLEDIGLTKGEVAVYLSLLELGETTTGAIIKSSRITGSKVYEILDKLIKKGLVSYITKERTRFFQASSPKRLIDYVEAREKEIAKRKRNIESIIPSLEAIREIKKETQSAQLFEGYEGIRTVFNMILEQLDPGDEYYAFSLGEELKIKKVTAFLNSHHGKRIRKKIRLKIIADLKDKALFKYLSRTHGITVRFVENPVPLGVFIFKDYIATFTFREKPTAFLIKSQQISDSYRKFFNYIWGLAKKQLIFK
jgi:sugar-specific transcriptional regulator TrmB